MKNRIFRFNKTKHLGVQFVFTLLLWNPLTTSAQHQTLPLIPPSPESMALIRGITYPTGMNTGVPDIHVPLYNIVSRDLQIPIVLRYHAAGIKVQDMPTHVGMGWRLSAGGRITRIVRHLPDGYGHRNKIEDDNSPYFAESMLDTYSQCDMEPDIFYFDLCGRTGMFVLDADENAFCIPYQNLQINKNADKGFSIIDEYGIKYIFENYQDLTLPIKLPDYEWFSFENFSSTWHLEKIESPAGDIIELTYQCDTKNYTIHNERFALSDYYFGSINQILDTGIWIELDEMFVTNIRWKSGEIDFCYSEESLDSIRIFSSDSKYLKSIGLRYGNFKDFDCITGRYSGDNRLRLEQIFESSQGLFLPIARFEYENRHYSYESYSDFPMRESKDYDHWGYFNLSYCGGENQTNLFYEYMDEYINRDPDDIAKTGILKRKYHASGGYEEYEFELNDTPEGKAGGLRLKSLTQYPGGYKTECIYRLPENSSRSSGCARLFSMGYALPTYYCVAESRNMNELLDIHGAPVWYSSVTVKNPNGSKCVWEYDFVDDIDAELTWFDNCYEDSFSSALFPHTLQFWKRGLLKKASAYDADDHLVESTEYFYNTETEIKASIPGFSSQSNPLYYTSPPVLAKYYWHSQAVLLDSVISDGRDIIRQVTSYTYDPDKLVALTSKTSTADGNIYTTHTTYPFQYHVNGSSIQYPEAFALKAMRERNMNALPVEIVSRKNGKVVAATLNEYKITHLDSIGQQAREAIVPAKIHTLSLNHPLADISPYRPFPALWRDPAYNSVVCMDLYDSKGNLLQTHKDQEEPVSFIYSSYNGTMIAQITHAAHTSPSGGSNTREIYYNGFETEPSVFTSKDISGVTNCFLAKEGQQVYRGAYHLDLSHLKPGEYIVSYWLSVDEGKNWSQQSKGICVGEGEYGSATLGVPQTNTYIDEILAVPVMSQTTVRYTTPGVGVIYEKDAQGEVMEYKYDALGRIISISDGQGDILKEYEYYLKQ